MPDETTSTPPPVDTAIPQAPETPISTPPETVIVPAPTEAPVEPVLVSEPIPETPSGQMGGNDPIELAPAENILSVPALETPAETPVAVAEPVPIETITPEPAPEETTQPTQTEPVIETVSESIAVETLTPAQTRTEAPPVAQVETPAPTQIPEPVTHARVPEPTPIPVATTIPTPAQIVATAVAPVIATLNSSRLGASGEASATRIEASPQAPLAENINSQTFTKSMRELFTKALNARQNKKRKKLDRIMSLFAKQTMITNNEVEELLHVSDSTATRYLATLTKEGKLKQNVKKGQATSYSKI